MNRVDAFLFLTRCLAPEHAQPNLAAEITAGRVSWERVVEIASESWMTLVLYRQLDTKRLLGSLPPNDRTDLLEYFQAIHDANEARNREILAHAEEVVGMLNGIGVEPLLLKGAANLATGLYADPAVRFMDDIDLLVPDDRALDCWRLLTDAGYQTNEADRNKRVEDLSGDWPFLQRADRRGELEIHRAAEWNHLLSQPSLYADTLPLTLGDGKARILNPTSRIIFTLAHAYVHELRGRRAGTPFRDLYDATLMTRSLDREIDWRRVKDTFDRAGEAEGLRVAGMMWRRLFSENPPGGIDPPRWGRIYWQRCLLKIRSARWGIIGDHLAQNVRALGTAFSGTAEGKQMREEFSKPAALRRKLRTALRLYSPPRGQGGGHGTGQ